MTQGEGHEPQRRRAGSEPGGKGGSERLADLLRTRREASGLSRRELAEVTGLSYPYISQLETGYRLPSPKVMQLLAAALGADPGDLLDAATARQEPFPAGPPAAAPRAAQGRYLANPAHISPRDRPAAAVHEAQQATPTPTPSPALLGLVSAVHLSDRPEPPAEAGEPSGPSPSPGDAVAVAVAALQSVPAAERLAALNEVQAAVLAALVDERGSGG